MSFSCFIFGDDTLTFQAADILRQRGHEVRGIVTQSPDVIRWGRQHEIPVIDPEDDILAIMSSAAFDYLFSIANLRMLCQQIVDLPTRGAINFHDGPLPRYAGIHATSWAILNQETTHGITWHWMGDTVDGGDILIDRSIEIAEKETAFSLNAKCFAAGMESFAELIERLNESTVSVRPQDLAKRTYFGKWKRPDSASLISWHRRAEEIEALVRATDLGPYPNAFGCAKIRIEDDVLVCHELELLRAGTDSSPGTICSIDADTIEVAAGDGRLQIRQLFRRNGEPISAAQLVQRYQLKVGDRLPVTDDAQRERITRLNKQTCRSEQFWRRRLAELQGLCLPYVERISDADDQCPSDVATIPFSLDEFSLDEFSTTNCPWSKNDAREVVAAAFALYLGRLGSESRFDLGLRCPQRDQMGIVPGLFAESVPWRVDMDPMQPVDQSMKLTLESLTVSRDQPTYLLDVWNRYPELQSQARSSGIQRLSIHLDLNDTVDDHSWPQGCDLLLAIGPTSQLAYRTATMTLEHASRVLEQFRTFFGALCRVPQTPICRLPLLTESERQRMVIDWNETSASFPGDKCVPHLFEAQVAQRPDAIAVVFEDQEISFRDLNHQANQLAAHLQKLGVKPDVGVGVFVDRSIEMVIALLGIMKAGGGYVPLDPAYPEERLAFIIEDSQLELLIVQDRLRSALPDHRATVVRIDGPWSEIAGGVDQQDVIAGTSLLLRPDHLAYMIYTSGSTGRPKGVMVEHRHAVSFFTGMDERIVHQPGDVWLAVTSLSFDISVLELFWSLSRGLKVVIHSDRDQSLHANVSTNGQPNRNLDFSLFYFSADQGEQPNDKYRLLIEGAKFADQHGFTAVWTPERHFHEFGGLYPNPAVTSAALATITKNIELRAGSVVAPLHSPIRIAEEWALVDNLSGGRVAIAFASGWMPNDFVICPDNFEDKKEKTFRHLDLVRRLWRGEEVEFPGPLGTDVAVQTLPRPIQPELPVWITTAGNPETYEMAAKAGANILTHLLGQTIEEVGEKIDAYRASWRAAGHPGRGHVSLMVHTFVGEDLPSVRAAVRQPLINYLRTSTHLLKSYSSAFPAFKNQDRNAEPVSFDDLADDELDAVMEFAFDRYFETSGLFGTPEDCRATIDQIRSHGVDEVACLIDFGVPTEVVLNSLKHLTALKSQSNDEVDRIGDDGGESVDYRFATMIKRHGVTHFQCTPSMARILIADPENRQALARLQVVMIGGEAFPADLANELRGIVTGRLINMYGPTETTIWSSTHELQGEKNLIPIGRPILNTQFYVVNRALEPQPVLVPGELLVGGAGVTRGYHNRSELTNERFIPNPFKNDSGFERVYRTGDLVRYLPDGNVEFLGRLDHQVKIRGHRIELGEIEYLLTCHPRITEAVVVAREDIGDKRLVAYVKTSDGQPVPSVELREFISERLPEYMVPARVVHLKKFPLTPNQKVDRNALPAPDRDATEAKREFQAPVGQTEFMLAEIWTEVLGIRDIGRQDDFFLLGGDSLSLVQVTIKCEQRFGKRLSIGEFVQARTLENTARLLDDPVNDSIPIDSSTVENGHVVVRQMKVEDLEAVIDLHLENFSQWRISVLGRPFLRKMYRWLIENHNDLALVATIHGQVVGFTVGTVGPFKRPVFLNAWPEVIAGAIRHPAALARNGINRIRARSQSNHIDPQMSDLNLAHNRISAISPTANGAGIQLLAAFERAAQNRGTKPYFHDGNTPNF